MLIAVFAAYGLLVYWADSSVCVVRAMTGLPCPGCGLTTAAIALAKGNVAAACHANAMIFALPPVCLVILLDKLLRRKSFSRFAGIVYLTASAAMLIYFLVRVALFFPHGPAPMIWRRDNIPCKIISVLRNRCPGLSGKNSPK